jgi:hypothetical protein
MQEMYGDDVITTADKIKRPDPKPIVKEIEAINEFVRRNPRADGGRIGFKKGKGVLPKNIRLTPEGNYRFASEASGEFFSKTFPKETKIKDVVKFRDDYLADLKEKGLLRKEANPKRSKYVSVKGQKHIKFNGVTYQVSIQRKGQKAKYFNNLNDAIEKRDALIKKYPPKSLTDYNIKEKTKKVNADILELHKDPTIKNMFKNGVFDEKGIAKAAQILGVNKGTAIDRLEDLATAYLGDRKNVPGIKPAFIKNAKKILLELPKAKTKAAELAVGIPLEGESISIPKGQITSSKTIPPGIADIDEARATATGLKRSTSPYSIFAQVIDRNVNRIAKGGFGGAGWDSRAGTLEANLDKAIQKFGANSKEAKAAVLKYNQEATKFENEVNSKKFRGAKRVRIPRISLDAPSQTIANYNKFNKKYKDVFNENFKTKKYSFVIPKDLKTIPELRNEILDPNSSTYKTMINHLKKGFNEFDEKKLFEKIKNSTPNQIKKIMRFIPRIARVDDISNKRYAALNNTMTSGVKYVDDAKENFIERNPKTTTAVTAASSLAFPKIRKPLMKAAGKTLSALTGPLPIAGMYAIPGFGMDPKSSIDRSILGAELAFAPSLVKQSAKFRPAIQKLLNFGLSPKMAMRAARIANPIGIASLVGEGLYHLGKKGYDQYQLMKGMTESEKSDYLADQYEDLGGVFGEGAADGGLIGDKSGPAPIGGPMSQGLRSLYNNGKKL